jgi:hypothetical protein
MRREDDTIFFEDNDPRIVHTTWLGDSISVARAAEIYREGQREEESIWGLVALRVYSQAEQALEIKRARIADYKLQFFLVELGQLAPQ